MVGQCHKSYLQITLCELKIFLNFSESFTKSYKKENDEGYFLAVDIQYLENLHKLHNDLPFLPQRMKINEKKV